MKEQMSEFIGKVECLSCNEEIQIPTKKKIGDLIICTKCAAEMEIVDLEPIQVDWPYYEEDYTGEDDEYDDDGIDPYGDIDDFDDSYDEDDDY